MYYQTRWKQRFQNFEKAYLKLEKAIIRYNKTPDDELILEGLVQTYEFTYELTINTIKDYLISEGSEKLSGPRSVIKTALNYELIDHGQIWMDAISDRNLTSHTYNEEIAEKVVSNINTKYFQIIKEVYLFFKEKI